MKTSISAILFFFLFKSGFAGCESSGVKTSHGFTTKYNHACTVQAKSQSSTFTVVFYNGPVCPGSYYIKNPKIVFNGVVVFEKSGGWSGKVVLPETPGFYEISATESRFYLRLTIKDPPPNIDSVNAIETLIVPVSEVNPEFLVFPNPAQSDIQITNESEKIRIVRIFNSVGTLMGEWEPETTTLSLPLGDYPRGLYFIQVATLSDKILIRKLLLL